MRCSTTVRREARRSMRVPEFRVLCSCGWQEKARTRQEAEGRASDHEQRIKR